MYNFIFSCFSSFTISNHATDDDSDNGNDGDDDVNDKILSRLYPHKIDKDQPLIPATFLA